MPWSLAELALVAAAVWGLYRLLLPVQRRLEKALLDLLLGSDRVVDAETVEPSGPKRRNR